MADAMTAADADDLLRAAWRADWEAMRPTEREILVAVFPNLGGDFDPLAKKPVSRLVLIANARFAKWGLADGCSRCGGSGHYSYCQMYGTKCFKCGGSGKQAPRWTRKLLQAVREHAAAEVTAQPA